MEIKAWGIVSLVLTELSHMVKSGTTGLELDSYAEKRIKQLGGTPYNLNYHPKWSKTPFPAALCVCPNDVIVHGIPDQTVLKNGDIITLDLGVKKDNLCGDAALTVPVGEISNDDKFLLKCARKVIYKAIKKVKAGVEIGDISDTIYRYVKRKGFVANIAFCGHTIGEEMHEEPLIPNFRFKGLDKIKFIEGKMYCIEVPISYRDPVGVYSPDGWGVKTNDGKNAAMFEHQFLVKKGGVEILTTHF